MSGTLFPSIDLSARSDDIVKQIRDGADFGCMVLRNVGIFLGQSETAISDLVIPEIHSLFHEGHLVRKGGLDVPGVRYRNLAPCDKRNCKCAGVHKSCWKPTEVVKNVLANMKVRESHEIEALLDDLAMRRPSYAEILDFDEREWNAVRAGKFPISELLGDFRSGAIMEFHDRVRTKLMPVFDEWLKAATGVNVQHVRQDQLCQFRLARYPDGQKSGTLGLSPHTDTCLYTLVFNDAMGSLYVDSGGEWIAVPQCTGVVLFGWAMTLLSDGRFCGKRHVVAPIKGQRASCVFFGDLDLSRPLSVPGCGQLTWDELKVMKRCQQWRTRSHYDESLLHLASDHNVVHAARVACEVIGTPVDVRNWLERTPLHQAALAGSYEAAEYLLQTGAEVDSKDKYGLTPLHLAGVNGRECAWRLLQTHGADSASRNLWGSTPTAWRGAGASFIEDEGRTDAAWIADASTCDLK